MDEDQFRAIYHALNPQRCVFEKALNNRRCDCSRKQRFLLATREGVGCDSSLALAQCTEFLQTLRESSRFALKEVTIDGPLPHNKELKVQAGGCQALQTLVTPEASGLPEITTVIQQGLAQYGTIADFPYGELVRGVLTYESRRQRRGG